MHRNRAPTWGSVTPALVTKQQDNYFSFIFSKLEFYEKVGTLNALPRVMVNIISPL